MKLLGTLLGRRVGDRLARAADEPSVVLSPHFDDSLLDFWSVLSRSESVRVVNVFAAPPLEPCLTEWDAICGATDSVEWTERRRAEDAVALALVGRSPVNLPFRQASVRAIANEHPPSIEAIEEAIANAVGGASAVRAPAGIGGHPDHLLVRNVALRLARHGIPVYLHADLPYAVRTGGWPTWVDRDAGLAAADEEWTQFLGDIPALSRERADVVRLSPEQGFAKLAALQTYRTQFAQLDGRGRLLSRPRILAFEVSWAVPHA